MAKTDSAYPTPLPRPTRAQASFAEFHHGKRIGWISNADVRKLETEWLEEGRAEREFLARKDHAMATLAKYNIFAQGDAKKAEEDAKKLKALLEAQAKSAAAAAETAKAEKTIAAGTFNVFSAATATKRV